LPFAAIGNMAHGCAVRRNRQYGSRLRRSPQSAIGNQQSAISNRQSAISNQQSAISNQQ